MIPDMPPQKELTVEEEGPDFDFFGPEETAARIKADQEKRNPPPVTKWKPYEPYEWKGKKLHRIQFDETFDFDEFWKPDRTEYRAPSI